jgi:hypothetical protein
MRRFQVGLRRSMIHCLRWRARKLVYLRLCCHRTLPLHSSNKVMGDIILQSSWQINLRLSMWMAIIGNNLRSLNPCYPQSTNLLILCILTLVVISRSIPRMEDISVVLSLHSHNRDLRTVCWARRLPLKMQTEVESVDCQIFYHPLNGRVYLEVVEVYLQTIAASHLPMARLNSSNNRRSGRLMDGL